MAYKKKVVKVEPVPEDIPSEVIPEVESPVLDEIPTEFEKAPFTPIEDVVEIKEEVEIELIPKFEKAENKRMKEEALADVNLNEIKRLRVKLEEGTITDGEAAELYNLLAS